MRPRTAETNIDRQFGPFFWLESAALVINTALTALLVWFAFDQVKLSERLSRLEHARSQPSFSVTESVSAADLRSGRKPAVETLTVSASNIRHLDKVTARQVIELVLLRDGGGWRCPVLARGYFTGWGSILRRGWQATEFIALSEKPAVGAVIANPTTTILDVHYTDLFGERRATTLRYEDGQTTPLSNEQLDDLERRLPPWAFDDTSFSMDASWPRDYGQVCSRVRTAWAERIEKSRRVIPTSVLRFSKPAPT